MDSSLSNYVKQPMQKVFIPGRYPGDEPALVNVKQARRILIMRQKKAIKTLQKLET